MNANVNILNWFEISVSDTARAKAFYENVFDIKMETMDMMGMKVLTGIMVNGHGGHCSYDEHDGQLSIMIMTVMTEIMGMTGIMSNI